MLICEFAGSATYRILNSLDRCTMLILCSPSPMFLVIFIEYVLLLSPLTLVFSLYLLYMLESSKVIIYILCDILD